MGQAFCLDRIEVENARGMVDVEAEGAPLLIASRTSGAISRVSTLGRRGNST
jgi:hypothetical protein